MVMAVEGDAPAFNSICRQVRLPFDVARWTGVAPFAVLAVDGFASAVNKV